MTEVTSPSSLPRADPAGSVLAALRSSEGELSTALLELIERLELPFGVKDVATSQYRHVNGRLAALFGTTPDKMIGTADAQWLEAAQWPALRTAENAALAMTRGALTEHRLDIGGARREFNVARVGLSSAEGTPRLVCSLWTELTAHRTLGLRHALGEQPDIAFRAALHALTLKVFYQYGSDSCLELDLKTVSFGAQAPGLHDSVSAEAIRVRHESWTKALPKDSADLWDALGDWDSDSRAALFAHVVSLSVNAVHEAWNRRPRALAHADQLADAVDLDMSARWQPTVDTFLGRVTKARILQAVVEAKGQRAADRIAQLKKGDMATEAATLLNGTGWLPEPLRTPARETVADMSDVELAVVETAEVADETAMADDDGIADDDDVAAMTIAAE